MDTPASSEATAAKAVPKRRKFPMWRRVLSLVCIILSCILLPLSVIAIWLHDDLLDTDGYVNTITPLSENQEILEAVSTRVTNALFENLDVEKLAKENLPSRITFLAGPMTDALREFTHDATLRFLESDRFREVWIDVNRRAHEQVVKALTGGGDIIETDKGKVVLDLSPLVDNVKQTLSDRGVSIFDSVVIGRDQLRFVLFDAEGLNTAQKVFDLMNTLRWVLPLLVVVFLALGLWLAHSWRRALMRWGIGVVIACLVLGFALAFGRDQMLNALPADASRSANAAAFDIVVRLLRNTNRALFALGIVVAIAAFLMGSSRMATALRGRTTGALDGVGDRAAATGVDFHGVGAFVHRFANVFRIGGVVLAFVILIALDNPAASTVLWLALFLLVYLAIVQVFDRIGRDRATTPSGTA